MKSDLHDSLCRLCSAALSRGHRQSVVRWKPAGGSTFSTTVTVICDDCYTGNRITYETDRPVEEVPPDVTP